MRRCSMLVFAVAAVFVAGCEQSEQQIPAANPPPARSETAAEETASTMGTTRDETTMETTKATAPQYEPTAGYSDVETSCKDFASPMQAQNFYDGSASDAEKANMDPDGDGWACEELAQGPPQYQSVSPSDPETACLQKQMNEAVADRGQAYLDRLIDEGVDRSMRGEDAKLTDLLAQEGYVC